jgi:hypothetical protein
VRVSVRVRRRGAPIPAAFPPVECTCFFDDLAHGRMRIPVQRSRVWSRVFFFDIRVEVGSATN